MQRCRTFQDALGSAAHDALGRSQSNGVPPHATGADVASTAPPDHAESVPQQHLEFFNKQVNSTRGIYNPSLHDCLAAPNDCAAFATRVSGANAQIPRRSQLAHHSSLESTPMMLHRCYKRHWDSCMVSSRFSAPRAPSRGILSPRGRSRHCGAGWRSDHFPSLPPCFLMRAALDQSAQTDNTHRTFRGDSEPRPSPEERGCFPPPVPARARARGRAGAASPTKDRSGPKLSLTGPAASAPSLDNRTRANTTTWRRWTFPAAVERARANRARGCPWNF